MEVTLAFIKKNGEHRELPSLRPTAILGRRQDCDLRIPLSGVSRQHCELVARKGKVIVKDLASSNGTFVNNHRISEQELKGGDVLKLGSIAFMVRIAGSSSEISPPQIHSSRADVKGADEYADIELDPLDDNAFDAFADDGDNQEPIS
ncbi:MAG: FHA domain-containing protein [Planctomycetes bacterium]|nr:FHA domain-containing protein [Planctomycetota bacterium]